MPAKPLNFVSGMPQIQAALSGWTIPISLLLVVQEIVNGLVVSETPTPITVNGVWQPLHPKEIALKPEGQRAWSWIMLHVEGAALPFVTNDRIIRDGIRYKVMALKDYSLNNYNEFHLVLDYQDQQ